MRKRRRHLRDAEAQSGKQHRHDPERDQHAAEAAFNQPKIPAEEVTRYHGTDPERPQLEDPRAAPKCTSLEVGFARLYEIKSRH